MTTDEKKTIRRFKPAILTLFTLLVLFAGSYWLAIYQKTHEVSQHLKQANAQIKADTSWQSRLQDEEHLLGLIDRSQVRNYSWLGFRQVNTDYLQIDNQYRHDFNQHLIPHLKNITLKTLELQNTLDPLSLYNATKAYLLASKQHRNELAFQSNWYRDKIQPSLMPALQRGLQHNLLHWSIEPDEISRARTKLLMLDNANISFLVIQSHYPSNLLQIHFNSIPSPILNTKKLAVNELYSSNVFFDMYNKKIPSMTPTAIKGDWVTGPINPTELQPITDLITQVQTLYLKQFQLVWQQRLNTLHLTKTNKLIDLSQLINELQQAHSPVWQLLTTLNNNATLYDNTPNPLANFLAQNRGYKGFQAALFIIQKQIHTLLNNDAPLVANFKYTSQRMLQKQQQDNLSLCLDAAKQLPTPINHWLTTITERLWQRSLANSKTYIQQQWHKQVMQPYLSNIANRYPIDQHAKTEIKPKQFDAFFSPKGTLNTFVQQYLAAYLTQNKQNWSLKSKDDVTLGLSKTFVEMLTQANLIKNTLYSNNKHNAHMSFTLEPISLDINTTKATINLEGQMYTIDQTLHSANTFNWPGPYPGFVTMQFTGINKKPKTITYTGPWAWFRVIDNAEISTTNASGPPTLHISLGNSGATYALTATSGTRPSIPKLLAQFRSPAQL